MKEVVIVDAVRTPVGNHGGVFRDVDAKELARIVIRGILDRTRIDPAKIDEVIFGCIAQPSDAPNITRVAALMAGVPKEVPAYTVARNCDSGMDALVGAWREAQVGDGEIFIVGGVESMSNIPYIVKGARWGLKIRHAQFTDAMWEGLTDPVCGQLMGRTAENLAEEFNIPRQEQDEFAVQSHKKAFMATRMEKFVDEIVPVEVVKKVAGQEVAKEKVLQDETINPGLTVQKAALYPTVFKEGGSVTPANACGISDGASAMLVMTADKAKELGYEPLARIVAYAYAGVEPQRMGIAPAFAIPKALKKAGLALKDMDLIEINEAFAAQVLSVGKALKDEGWDWSKVNVNGGAIALGHPVGSSGCRIVVTMLHEMKRRATEGKPARYGLATLCAAGGQGSAIIVERVNAAH
ncbi:MAG: acetyl-CoA acetyltransferase [Anaerolineales bacterium]|nr:acetyl-CoA acetyltransferase [Anaerolineales bacterium]